MSRDIRAVVDGIITRPDLTIVVLAISNEDAHGIERETYVTLNVKEPTP